MLNIYIRKELNMRKGKMAAQVAHAAMKLFLEIMEKKGNTYFLRKENLSELKNWINNEMPINIAFVTGVEGIDLCLNLNYPFSKIIDRGLTEFGGVHTLTCAAQGIFKEGRTHEVVFSGDSEIKAKQHLIFSKDNGLNKENVCILSAKSAILTIYNHMIINPNNPDEMLLVLEEESSMYNWLNGAFAKIGLGVKSREDLNYIEIEMKKLGFGYGYISNLGNSCLFTYPQKSEDISVVTKNLSLI